MEDSILIVDDDSNVLSALRRSLAGEPCTVYTADNGFEGLNIMKEHKIKLLISDEMMPGMSGTELLSAAKKLFPHTIRIMLTGHASVEAAMRAVNNGEIYRFFAKPWDNMELKQSIHMAIGKYDLEQENRRLLRTVKNQAVELKVLEKRYPGITRLDRDESGNLVLLETPDAELEKIIEEFNTAHDRDS